MRPPRSNNITISSRVRSVTARKSRLAMDSWEASQNDRLRLLILRAGESQDKPAGRETLKLASTILSLEEASYASPDYDVTLQHDPLGLGVAEVEPVAHAAHRDGRHARPVEAQLHGLAELDEVSKTDGSLSSHVIQGDAGAQAVHGDVARGQLANAAAAEGPYGHGEFTAAAHCVGQDDAGRVAAEPCRHA